jgi:hypothetical protein
MLKTRNALGRGLHASALRRAVASLGILLSSALPSCNYAAHKYDSTVTGTVTIDGELARSGIITFHPATKEGKIAIGHIYSDGSFSLRTGQGNLKDSDGGTVPSGDYIVTVIVNAPAPAGVLMQEGAPPLSGKLLVAQKYISKDTSDVRRTVNPGRNLITVDLEGAKEEEAASPENSADQSTATEPPGNSGEAAK